MRFIVLALIIVLAGCGTIDKSTNYMLAGQSLNIEIVSSTIATTKGLSGRDPFDDSYGMLFHFNDLKQRSFWMNDMKFPIDIIWIADSKVVGISKNVPLYEDNEITIRKSPGAVNEVLEVNGGWSDRYNLEIGDSLIKS